MTVNEKDFDEALMQTELDFTSDNELSLFEDESEMSEHFMAFPDRSEKVGEVKSNTMSGETSKNAGNVGANMTFMSKSVFTLISNIFKCPVSEETLKDNIPLSAPKIPFLNIRQCDPWLKNLNPNVVADCLESEVVTQRFISNFLRVAFPLVNLLDAMSKGRITQSRVETSVTDSLLLLSSALESVNSWRRENIMRRYNLNHLKNPDVSPAENPYLFPSYFEKCVKFPSVEDLYQANPSLPDLEINSVSKFSNEVVSGESIASQLDSKLQKLISESYLLQKMGKDNFTQTSNESKTSSVGSQVKSCKCSVLGGVVGNAGAAQGVTVHSDSLAVSNIGTQRTISTKINRTVRPNKNTSASDSDSSGIQEVLPEVGPGRVLKESNSSEAIHDRDVSPVKSANYSDSTQFLDEQSEKNGTSAILKNDVLITDGKDKDSSRNDFVCSDDVEIVAPKTSNDVFGNISSGITIEDNDVDPISCENVVQSDSGGAVKEMESEIVILEVCDETDDEKSLSQVRNAEQTDFTEDVYAFDKTPSAESPGFSNSDTLKKRFVPITGPSPPVKTSVSARSSINKSVHSLNVKRTPVRPLASSNNAPLESLHEASSFSNLSKNRESGVNKAPINISNVTRYASPAPQRSATPANRSLTAYQHAAAIAGFGMPSPTIQQSSGNRIVRPAVDPFPSFTQQTIPAKRTRYDTQWNAQEYGSQQGASFSGINQRHQQPGRGGGGANNFQRRTNRRGF